MNEYRFWPLGEATTIPAPGNGSGSTYLARLSAIRLAALFAAGSITARRSHGRMRAALAPTPYCRKLRLEIVFMALALLSRNAHVELSIVDCFGNSRERESPASVLSHSALQRTALASLTTHP